MPFGSFEDVVMTKDTTRLEREVVGYKYYARGVGHVLRTSRDGGGREELVRFTR